MAGARQGAARLAISCGLLLAAIALVGDANRTEALQVAAVISAAIMAALAVLVVVYLRRARAGPEPDRAGEVEADRTLHYRAAKPTTEGGMP